MRIVKIILIVLAAGLVLIQFIQPAHNSRAALLPGHIENTVNVPPHVQVILQQACYDCHSNNTRYPWYSGIQPGAWVMAGHISEGKQKLNLSEFGSLSDRRKLSKLKEMAGQVKSGEMPLASYKLLHRDARLSAADKALLLSWINETMNAISEKRNE